MRTLSIDRSFFTMAFGRDVDYLDWPPRRFLLDRSTGEVLWFYECDEEAVRAFRAYREARIAAMAEEFLRDNGVVPEWKSRAWGVACFRGACHLPASPRDTSVSSGSLFRRTPPVRPADRGAIALRRALCEHA